MSLAPRHTADNPQRGRVRQWTGTSPARAQQGMSRHSIARRRMLVVLGKFLLPVVALGLLTLMAIWPELDRATEQARMAFRRMSGAVDGASMIDARYRGVDERGRPYTLTAERARQSTDQKNGQNRIALVEPKGDLTLSSASGAEGENEGWLMVQSHEGVFMQHSNELDLSRDVLLYRADGMAMRTQSMAVDLKAGAAAGAEFVHVEGPLGTLDAQGFVLFDKGNVIQFTGPVRAVVNGAER